MVIDVEELRLRGIDVGAIADSVGVDAFCWRAEREFWESLDGSDYIEDAIESAAERMGIELLRVER